MKRFATADTTPMRRNHMRPPLIAAALIALTACSLGNGLPVDEVYERGNEKIVIRSAKNADYSDGDGTVSATYEIEEDGRVRLEVPVFGTTQVVHYNVTDLGLQEVGSDGTLGRRLFTRANVGCAAIEDSVRRLRGSQPSREYMRVWGGGYAVDVDDRRLRGDRLDGVFWQLTGVPEEYWIVVAGHDECSMVYRYASHDSEMRGFFDIEEDELEAWWEGMQADAAAERQRIAQRAAAERARAAAAAAAEAERRRELVAESKVRRQTYGTFVLLDKQYDGLRRLPDRSFTVEVTDVGITGLKPVGPSGSFRARVEETGNPADMWWYCHLSEIEEISPYGGDEWSSVRFHGWLPSSGNTSYRTDSLEDQWSTGSPNRNREFAEAVTNAFEQWKARFGEVKSRKFGCSPQDWR